MPDLNYFICTLGQAARLYNRPFQNVNHLIDKLAAECPTLPAIGFYIPLKDGNDGLGYVVLSFRDLRNGSLAVLKRLESLLTVTPRATLGLLSSSSPQFLFTWLACIRGGYPVLLIAPQCSPTAIAQLCKTCNTPLLLVDDKNVELATRASNASQYLDHHISVQQLPLDDSLLDFSSISQEANSVKYVPVSEADIAYLHHTSGTSSGIPKPVPQSHKAAVGVLPSLDGSRHATFTTTPLYHGGIADVFRAWSSKALIWLFPSKELPVTASNIVKCLDTSANTCNASMPPIRYFSSVPYVLQMLVDNEQALAYLRSMDLVGVGGAALPVRIGDRLVENGVHLVSRYGSAECGFLMSSWRDFERDKFWHHLRPDPAVSELTFVHHGDGLAELVVRPGWPHMAKTNRNDGSYATADLFVAHDSVPNAWNYHSRADSQLTLITGKKFDPAPLEDALCTVSQAVSDVLVFGNGRPYPGALLFRSNKGQDIPDEQICEEIWTELAKLNEESQSHARISRMMLLPMSYQPSPLAKSSKGTVLRASAELKYADVIEAMYSSAIQDGSQVADSQVGHAIMEIIQKSIVHQNEPLTLETDLFAYGVDSVSSIHIRNALCSMLPSHSSALPMTVVQDCGSVGNLQELIFRLRHGDEAPTKTDDGSTIKELVKQYTGFCDQGRSDNMNEANSSTQTIVILLTGATGSLGAHVLSQLLSLPQVTKIYLLVRGATHHAARQRVLKALSLRLLEIPDAFDERVTILPCKVSESTFNISGEDYGRLAEQVDLIFHLAWSVNFLLALHSFQNHLAGLQNLINLALFSSKPLPPKLIFCSSVASVSDYSSRPVPERIIDDPSASASSGYAMSKLVAELICEAASLTRMKDRISIVRVGQLSGDTRYGIWSKNEAYPLILSGAKFTKALPDLGEEERLTWLPVDVAARAVIETGIGTSKSDEGEDIEVLHLVNAVPTMTFTDMLQYLQKAESFEIVSAHEWLARLVKMQQDSKFKDNPALKLLPFWRNIYGQRQPSSETGKSNSKAMDFEIERAVQRLPFLKPWVGPLQASYLSKLWDWVQREV